MQHLALKTGKFPKNGDPGAIRTRDVLLRRQTLYPTEVRDHVPKNLDISKLFGSLLIMIHEHFDEHISRFSTAALTGMVRADIGDSCPLRQVSAAWRKTMGYVSDGSLAFDLSKRW